MKLRMYSAGLSAERRANMKNKTIATKFEIFSNVEILCIFHIRRMALLWAAHSNANRTILYNIRPYYNVSTYYSIVWIEHNLKSTIYFTSKFFRGRINSDNVMKSPCRNLKSVIQNSCLIIYSMEINKAWNSSQYFMDVLEFSRPYIIRFKPPRQLSYFQV